MLDSRRQWELFGYDMRHVGRHWLAAWRGFIWSDQSPLRSSLDGVVQVHRESDTVNFQAGRQSLAASYECEAVLLPEEQVLLRPLSIPAAAEADLESALALEVSASSPFSADDTGYGWHLVARNDTELQLVLILVSRSAVMAYLGRQYGLHDARAREVWVEVEGAVAVVRGFGEARREQGYKRRLQTCGIMVIIGAALLMSVAAVSAGGKRLELKRMQEFASVAQREAAEAAEMRESLAEASEVIVAANDIIARYPNPHFEIARLSAILDDDAHLLQFSMTGDAIRIRGRAQDAAKVMQKLTDEPAYGEVTAPQAIVKVGSQGLEQFSLDVRLAGMEDPG